MNIPLRKILQPARGSRKPSLDDGQLVMKIFLKLTCKSFMLPCHYGLLDLKGTLIHP